MKLKLALLTAIATLALSAQAQAAVFDVNSTTDAVDASTADGVCATVAGVCTLRAASQQANATAGTDTINVPAGDYALTIPGAGENASATGDLDFTQSVTLVGAGARKTIVRAPPLDRIFDFVTPGTSDLISGMTVTGGRPNENGGGISTSGNLSLIGVALVDNNAETTSNYSGGGLDTGQPSVLTVVNSTIAGNSGYNGGGMSFDDGSITNSTISGNKGGTPTLNGDSGGFDGDVVNVTNSTIAGNSCYNGSGCRGAFSADTASQFKNTIVAGNRYFDAGPGGASGPDSCNTVTSTGNNIEDLDNCNFHATGDKVNTNPLLAPLANNGGETDTHALAADSPALNAGDDEGCPATDQRGGTRLQPHVGACDIGAFELGGLADLQITGSTKPSPVDAGSALTYTLTVTNPGPGPDPAAGVAVSDALPPGTTFISVKPSQGSCTGTATVNCTLGTLVHGASATIALAVKPIKGGKLENAATVSGLPTDPDPANNTAKLTSTVRVAISTLALNPKSFKPAKRGGSIARSGGATVTYSLFEPAKMRFTVERATKGRKVGSKCRAKTRKNRKRKSCTLYKKVKGDFSHSGKAGTNKFKFTGRLKRRALKRGNYRLVAVASNSSGASQPKLTNFKIKR